MLGFDTKSKNLTIGIIVLGIVFLIIFISIPVLITTKKHYKLPKLWKYIIMIVFIITWILLFTLSFILGSYADEKGKKTVLSWSPTGFGAITIFPGILFVAMILSLLVEKL